MQKSEIISMIGASQDFLEALLKGRHFEKEYFEIGDIRRFYYYLPNEGMEAVAGDSICTMLVLYVNPSTADPDYTSYRGWIGDGLDSEDFDFERVAAELGADCVVEKDQNGYISRIETINDFGRIQYSASRDRSELRRVFIVSKLWRPKMQS